MMRRYCFRSFHIPRLLSTDSTHHVSPDIYKQPVPKPDDEIIVAMSAGVDSSVTAALYASQYTNTRGVYMANWIQTSKCTESDWNDVQRVCAHLNIPCERVNFEKEYWSNVFEPMIENYRRGITPNPDISCNKYVKFGKLIEHLNHKYSQSSKNWWLATGHYARILQNTETMEHHLFKSSYPNKDQSYYLSMLPPGALKRLLMPIGHHTKPDVRELAKKYKLHTAQRPDSQGLCFISQTGNFRDFLDEYLEPNPGNIITEDGTVVGKHQGIWHATIGQRSGFSLPQGDPKYKGIWYVKEKLYDSNEIVIVKDGNNPRLFSQNILATGWKWLEDMSREKLDLIDINRLTIRYRSLAEPSPISKIEVIDKDKIEVSLKCPGRAIAPGQNLVLYDEHRVLGAGTIDRSWS